MKKDYIVKTRLDLTIEEVQVLDEKNIYDFDDFIVEVDKSTGNLLKTKGLTMSEEGILRQMQRFDFAKQIMQSYIN